MPGASSWYHPFVAGWVWGRFLTGGWGKNRYSKENSANTNAVENRIDHLGFLCCGVWILAGSNKSKWRQRILLPKWTSQPSVFSQLVTSLTFIWEAAMQGGQELHWWLILFLTHWLQSPCGWIHQVTCLEYWKWNWTCAHGCAHTYTCNTHIRHRWTLKNCSWLFRLNLCHLEQT